MGATIVLFTIALIVLLGAALAYAGRDNPSTINTQSARIYAAVLLKQSADYRDAYSRFIFDGGDGSTMKFDQTATVGLFNTTAQYGTLQLPPPQSGVKGGTAPVWAYNDKVLVSGVGTPAGTESVAYVIGVNQAVCSEVNNQMYGAPTIDSLSSLTPTDIATSPATFGLTPAGRSVGCFSIGSAPAVSYVFYTTLGES